jgi:hypothetical protein
LLIEFWKQLYPELAADYPVPSQPAVDDPVDGSMVDIFCYTIILIIIISIYLLNFKATICKKTKYLT